MKFIKFFSIVCLLPLLPACDNKGRVECSQIEGGVSCATERQKGLNEVSACWTIEYVCANGTKIKADACAPLPLEVGSKGKKIIAWSEFSNYSSCDRITDSGLTNVRGKPNSESGK
jgi:hypothetical protein